MNITDEMGISILVSIGIVFVLILVWDFIYNEGKFGKWFIGEVFTASICIMACCCIWYVIKYFVLAVHWLRLSFFL